MPHNLSLPRHRYIWVVSHFVLQEEQPTHLIPAVWFGVSVTPDRMMGCHVVLENGAMVVDLPLHALRAGPNGDLDDALTYDVSRWDMYGWDAEVFEPPYVTQTTVEVLDRSHQKTGAFGRAFFAIDHLKDGYSMAPFQHKHLWVIGMFDTGRLVQVPQDQLLIHEASFTDIDEVPRIKRQDRVWRCE